MTKSKLEGRRKREINRVLRREWLEGELHQGDDPAENDNKEQLNLPFQLTLITSMRTSN